MRVLVVDDHPIMRLGLRQLLLAAPVIASCSEAGNVADALALVQRERPDAIVVDLSLGKESGLDLIARLRARDDTTPILVLSMFDEALYAQRVLRAGAQGYLMKEASTDHLIEAVQRIVRGDTVVSAAMNARFNDAAPAGAPSGLDALTPRELIVLRLIGQGQSPASIARVQSRSTKTIEAHRESIKRKLGLQTASELTRFAALWLERHGKDERIA